MEQTGRLILVVEDDASIRDSLDDELRAAGYTTVVAREGREGLASFRSHSPDLVLTDLAMPVSDGFALISSVRESSSTPIIVLSVRGGEQDKARALELGADDYLTKPFSVPELLARIHAQLRPSARLSPTVLAFEDLVVDLGRRRVVQAERELELTSTEFALLELLATNAGKPVLMSQIIARVWEGASEGTTDNVRALMGSLRRKLEPDPSNPRYIVSEPWVGYRFIAKPLNP